MNEEISVWINSYSEPARANRRKSDQETQISMNIMITRKEAKQQHVYTGTTNLAERTTQWEQWKPAENIYFVFSLLRLFGRYSLARVNHLLSGHDHLYWFFPLIGHFTSSGLWHSTCTYIFVDFFFFQIEILSNVTILQYFCFNCLDIVWLHCNYNNICQSDNNKSSILCHQFATIRVDCWRKKSGIYGRTIDRPILWATSITIPKQRF